MFISPTNLENRLLSKLASDRKFEGGSEKRTEVYIEVHEDFPESAYKLPIEDEFKKESNVENGKAPVVAALDLGTNSCRLLIARLENKAIDVIDSYSKVVRLGEGIKKNGQLSLQAMNRTVKALEICRDKIIDNKVIKLRAVTTEACRQAVNGEEFIQKIMEGLHFNIEIISNAEEARLSLSGCSGVLDSSYPYALIFDIGGGSTEVMWLKLPRTGKKCSFEPGIIAHQELAEDLKIIDWISLPYGVVTLSDVYGPYISTDKMYYDIRRHVRKRLFNFSRKNRIPSFMKHNEVQIVGSSGTVTTLAAFYLNLSSYNRSLIDGLSLKRQDVRNVCHYLQSLSYQERIKHPCIGVGRADLVIVGAAILEGIYDTWPLPRLKVADRGVREGILLDLMKEFQ